ncbi:hydroxymethylglutaryl-CoA reductase, degradative [Candidatus Micrarchaeota archaeon CG08_land_8_20_14_0_20_49_17]|nr:MAG: hydroxymethylglutaryl-CoA reductase, degradative [Candidatus Micrarchaeota archaeon CG1_02_49_24]PIU10215.1 MAG: hydroxymethylglutaryl-CoA reductase, degradative [Candidatus Micrarchaeota archaeon CG08_land_8_20_14_0_20_49_17]PIU82440.1 MAG: hydroxymethylglutaryl-CoA reductase, degradative [Candidatus Micrarchaeota archaeon CG06_land_8_20_14_3_00_50_6]PJA00206.1 MAG: hydroxymethylglutaryl-CoA reductase, degradative [Candidatus Micrarchaeota archaeon CG_4_10_14_0_2_um_filter_49_7]HII5380
MDSSLPEFYKKTVEERKGILKDMLSLSDEELRLLDSGGITTEQGNRMAENVIGQFALPLGIAANFRINGNDVLIPMATEEPSVIAAASYAAKLCRPDGFVAKCDAPIMTGQIYIVGVKSPNDAKKKVLARKMELIAQANSEDRAMLVKYGGGVKEIEARAFKNELVVYVSVDCRDAMGANAVNTICETLAPEIEKLSGGTARMRILSNLAIKRKAYAKATWKKDVLQKSVKIETNIDVVSAMLEAYKFAVDDQFRATTHNKGIMNGIDAVVIATGNDFRAVEAGAHSYAAYEREYTPLTRYYKDKEGNLVGEIELPIAVGIIGGATKTHPLAQLSLKIMAVRSAQELAQVIAAVGLAQNFAAMRALVTEGIQKGHMRLHAKNIAVMAGARDEEIDAVAELMALEKKVRVDRAKELLEKIRGEKR